MMQDRAVEKASWRLAKFDDPTGEVEAYTRSGHTVEDAMEKFPERFMGVSNFEPNLLLNAGITVLLNLLTAASGQTAFNNANSRLGVGDSSTTEAASQTGLQAATNHYWQVADATFPTVSGQVVTWQATFGGTVGNYAWNEFISDNDGAAGSTSTAPTYSSTLVALNRKVSSQGTKTAGQTWVLTLQITFS